MSFQSKHLRVTAILLLTIPFMQACQQFTSDAPSTAEAALGPQQTLAAFGQQTQAVSAMQTNTALVSQPEQVASPIATITPLVLPTSTETQLVSIGTVVPVIPPNGAPIQILYGQNLSGVPKNQHIIYVFGGTQGDVITILLESTVLGPNRPSCINSSPARVSFILKTPKTRVASINQSPQVSSLRDYVLPSSSAYYIDVSCSGRLCTCTQTDITLERK